MPRVNPMVSDKHLVFRIYAFVAELLQAFGNAQQDTSHKLHVQQLGVVHITDGTASLDEGIMGHQSQTWHRKLHTIQDIGLASESSCYSSETHTDNDPQAE